MTYSDEFTNKGTIFDNGDTINGSHVRDLYEELGDNPSGAHADVTARLTATDTVIAGKAAASHTHSASQITSGVLDPARVASGTPTAGTFLRGDGVWASPDLSVAGLIVLGADEPVPSDTPAGTRILRRMA